MRPDLLVGPAASSAATALGRMPLPALAAWWMEVFLLATHAKVLFAIGPDYSFETLKGRRYYFLVDLLSPWAALAAATTCCKLPGDGVPPAVLVMCALHSALHIFYIATWNSSRHTERVIRLSTTDARRRLQCGKYGASELAWFFGGTAYDMATHLALVCLLWSACGAAAASSHP